MIQPLHRSSVRGPAGRRYIIQLSERFPMTSRNGKVKKGKYFGSRCLTYVKNGCSLDKEWAAICKRLGVKGN